MILCIISDLKAIENNWLQFVVRYDRCGLLTWIIVLIDWSSSQGIIFQIWWTWTIENLYFSKLFQKSKSVEEFYDTMNDDDDDDIWLLLIYCFTTEPLLLILMFTLNFYIAVTVLLCSVIRWNSDYQQSRCEWFLHLPGAVRDVRAPTRLYLHAVGLQSMDWHCDSQSQSHICSTATCCLSRDSHFAVLAIPLQTIICCSLAVMIQVIISLVSEVPATDMLFAAVDLVGF